MEEADAALEAEEDRQLHDRVDAIQLVRQILGEPPRASSEATAVAYLEGGGWRRLALLPSREDRLRPRPER